MTTINASPSPEPEWHWRNTRWLPKLLAGLVVAASLVAVSYFARPAYRLLKDWRSRSLAASAERMMKSGDWRQAQQRAQAAYALNGNQPEAIHALARAYTFETNASALPLWQQLVQLVEMTAEDRRSLVNLALHFGALELAIGEVDALLKESPNNATNLWLAARLYEHAGQPAQAIYFGTRARLNAPENRAIQFFQSRSLFDAPDAAQRTSARQDVWRLARGTDALGLEVLRFLAARRDLNPEERRELIQLSGKHPAGGMPELLLGLEQQLALEPQRRREILDRAVAEAQRTSPDKLSAFAVWLNGQDEFARTTEVLPLAKAMENKDCFLALMDALGGLKRWQEISDILEKQRTPLEQVYLAAFMARCDLQLGKQHAANVHWQRALLNARNRPDQLVWLSQYAEKCGSISVARDACRALFGCVADLRAAYRFLAQLTERTGTTEELHELISLMRKTWPEEEPLRNDQAYLSLLLGKELDAAQRTAEALVEKSPDRLPYRNTLALAFLRANQPKAALQLYGGRQLDWRLAMPGQRAIYSAVLAANARLQEARDLASQIPRDRLRPEEFALIRPWLAAE